MNKHEEYERKRAERCPNPVVTVEWKRINNQKGLLKITNKDGSIREEIIKKGEDEKDPTR